MELVYLWVGEYKNIKQQGFNFSPRFTCKYDKENKNLTIIDKEETKEFYPKKFFGDNINIMTIIGENGSGKSRILESLIALSTFQDTQNKKVSFFFVIYQNEQYYKKCINININNNYPILQQSRVKKHSVSN